jgi:hypothetical protein
LLREAAERRQSERVVDCLLRRWMQAWGAARRMQDQSTGAEAETGAALVAEAAATGESVGEEAMVEALHSHRW